MIAAPKNYPEERYEVKFLTTIYHPNVAGNGDVCNCDYGLLFPTGWEPRIHTLKYALERL